MHKTIDAAWVVILGLFIFPFSGCGHYYVVAPHPFVLAEIPPDLPRQPVRVALVRTPAMQKFPTGIGAKERFSERAADAAFQGLADAASLIAAHVETLDHTPTAGFDLVCIPINPYFHVRQEHGHHYLVTLTLEVTVIETASGNKRGLLLEAEGATGKRPVVSLETIGAATEQKPAGVTGALIDGGNFDEAVNNALFYLALDFAEKLKKRAEQFVRGNAVSLIGEPTEYSDAEYPYRP